MSMCWRSRWKDLIWRIAALGGLTQRLALATRLAVEPAAPLSSLRMGKTGLTPEQLTFVEPLVTVPVGLAMGVAS